MKQKQNENSPMAFIGLLLPVKVFWKRFRRRWRRETVEERVRRETVRWRRKRSSVHIFSAATRRFRVPGGGALRCSAIPASGAQCTSRNPDQPFPDASVRGRGRGPVRSVSRWSFEVAGSSAETYWR